MIYSYWVYRNIFCYIFCTGISNIFCWGVSSYILHGGMIQSFASLVGFNRMRLQQEEGLTDDRCESFG